MTESALRREMLLAALVAALPIELAETASATPLNPEQTIIRLPAQLQWKSNPAFSEPSVDNCLLSGDPTRPGLYYTLVRWWPGFMKRHTIIALIACASLSRERGGATAELISTLPRAFPCPPAVLSTGSLERNIMMGSSEVVASPPSSPFAASAP